MGAFFSFLTTHLIISSFGVEAFADYGLLVSVIALLPFLDLGLGVAVVNVVAASRRASSDAQVRLVLSSVMRWLAIVFLVLLIVGFLIPFTLGWDSLLGGSGNSFGFSAGLCWFLFCFSLPLGIGSRILLGLNLNHWVVLLQGIQPPLTFALLLLLSHFTTASYLAPVLFFLSLFIANLAIFLVACHKLHHQVRRSFLMMWKLRKSNRAPVLATAAPMLLIMIAVPIALQSDRILLSHLGSTDEVAQYNLASQVYSPVWSVIATATASLWPHFMKKRANGHSTFGPAVRASSLAGGAAVAGGAGTVFVAPWLVSIVANGEVALPGNLLWAYALLIIVQGFQYPLGYALMDARGLRFQAAWAVVLAVVNVVVTLHFIPLYGAAGPLYASAMTVVACQLLPNIIYIAQRDKSRFLNVDSEK